MKKIKKKKPEFIRKAYSEFRINQLFELLLSFASEIESIAIIDENSFFSDKKRMFAYLQRLKSFASEVGKIAMELRYRLSPYIDAEPEEGE
jgi:hypothetical protein